MALPLKWLPAAAHGGAFKAPAATFLAVHSTESENTPAMAEALAGPNWFGGPKAGTSSHKVVDLDSICEGVHRNTVAYHAGPGGNTWGIAYEFCGRASWSAAKWREPAQLQMLRNAAPHMADDLVAITGSRAAARAACRWLSVVQVAQHAQGLCTHNDIRLAFPGTTTHSDPGPAFPYAELLAYVQAALADAPAAAPAVSEEDDDMPYTTFRSDPDKGTGADKGDGTIAIADFCGNPWYEVPDPGYWRLWQDRIPLRAPIELPGNEYRYFKSAALAAEMNDEAIKAAVTGVADAVAKLSASANG